LMPSNVVSPVAEPPGGMARRLARWRVPLGFVAGPIALALARPTWQSVATGGAIMAAGELVRVWAAGHLEKGREVTRSGPYRYVAHPLYLGSAVVGTGLAVATSSWWVTLLVTAYVLVTFVAAIRSEEAELRAAFGEEYVAYRQRRSPPMARPFSFSRAWRNREYRAVGGVVAAWGLLALRVLFGL